MALTKDPDAVLDYAFDWSAWLADGEVILTHQATIEAGDAVIDSTSQTPNTVVVWLSGGTLGTNVELRCRVTTDDGRIDDRTIVILIREVFAVDGCESWPVVGYTAPVGVDQEILAVAEQAAQAFLNGATGRRFGTCTYTQRFQVRATASGICHAPPDGQGNCCAIRLPNTPIQAVLGVKVDGVLIDPSSYAVLGGSRLGRLSGCWPQSADCEPGRIEVTYTAGIPLRPGSTYYGMAAAAMGEIVREYMAGLTNQACKLPSRFVSVARQGVTTVALDPKTFLDLALTGLPLTDNFIRTVNPGGHRRKPRVLSVDGARRN
jgi:hypothetical protein